MSFTTELALSVACTIAFIIGGVVHTVWLKSRKFQRFSKPIDGGRHFLGRPILGPNKTYAGFMVLPPTVAIAFVVIGQVDALAGWRVFDNAGWPDTVGALAGIGFLSALGYLLAELPNSFLKRRFGIASGKEPKAGWRFLTILIDQCDSILGALVVFSILAPTTPMIWGLVLVMATAVHFAFNAVLANLDVKEKAR